MDFDFEIEDILNSVKENKPDNKSEKPSPSTPIAPPKADLKTQMETPDISAFEAEERVGKSAGKAIEEPEKKEKVRLSFSPPEPILKVFDKLKAFGLKKVGIILCAVLVLILAVVGAVKIAEHSKTGYIKKYEKQYHVDFPDGILKEFCDLYGEDQSFSGTLTIKDTDTNEIKVYSKANGGSALLEKGSDVKEKQKIRAIAIDKSLADIESVYSTAKGFMNASQEVTFKTLFEEEKYRVVAAYYTNTRPEDDAGYVFPYNTYGNLTKGSFYQFTDRIKTKSLYDTGYKLLNENHILSISTQSDFMPDFRFVIVCVKCEDDFEKAETATVNNKVYYPQVWYDKNKKKNPYYLAGKWYPEIFVSDSGATKKLTMEDFQ